MFSDLPGCLGLGLNGGFCRHHRISGLLVSTLFPQWMNALPGACGRGPWRDRRRCHRRRVVLLHPQLLGSGVHAGTARGVFAPDSRGTNRHGLSVLHTNVEDSSHANVPDTATCINCHAGDDELGGYFNIDLWEAHKVNQNLVKVRTAYAEEPIQWRGSQGSRLRTSTTRFT